MFRRDDHRKMTPDGRPYRAARSPGATGPVTQTVGAQFSDSGGWPAAVAVIVLAVAVASARRLSPRQDPAHTGR